MLDDTGAAAAQAQGALEAWAEFRIDDPAQVLRWLQQLHQGSVPVHLHSPHGDALLSRLWSVDARHGQLCLAADADSALLQRLAEGDEIAAVSYLDAVKLQFDLDQPMLVHGSGSAALRARLPQVIYRFQRRGSYRVRTLERHAPKARLRHPSIPDMQLALRIVDVSTGGCALHLGDDQPALQPGSTLHGVRIELDGDTQFNATLRLQHVVSMHDSGGLRLGCSLADLDGAAQRALQRYIDRTQQRRRLLGAP